MASPVVTQNARGNIASNVALGAGVTSSAIVVDATNKFEVQLQIELVTGASATAGVLSTVKVYRDFGTGPTSDTVPITSFQIAMGTALTSYIQSIALPTGKYALTITNGDGSNGINYYVTSTTIDSIA